MSLLNEMLQDLAKQKSVIEHKTVYTAVAAPKKAKSIPNLILVGLMVLAVGLFFHLISKQSKELFTRDKAAVDTTVLNNTGVNHSTLLPIPLSIPIKDEPSYIESIDSPASSFIVLDTAEQANQWTDKQRTNLSELNDDSVRIKKVYAPQTIDEWRNAQLNKALKAIDEGLDQQAIATLQQVVDKIPTASDARQNLAVLYLYNNEYNNAARTVDEGLKYAPADAALITVKARLALDQGDANTAVDVLSRHKPSINVHPDYYGTLAAALQSLGRIVEAGSIYKALIQIEPTNGQYWLGYAIALEHNQKANEAIQAYNQASQKSDSDPSVREYAEDRLKILQG